MRRCTILEGTHQEAELLLCLLVREAQGVEHLVLQGAVVDTDGTTTNLHTVHHDVVGVGTDVTPLGRVVKQCFVFRLRGGEGMVHSVIALRLFVPFEQREVNDPQRCIFVGLAQAELVTHLKTQGIQLNAGLHGLATEDEHQVARLGTELVGDDLQVFRCVELIDGRLERAIGVVFDVDHATGTHLWTLHEFGEGIKLLAGVFRAAFSANADHQISVVEEAETLTFDHIVEFHELHPETNVGFVGAVVFHGIVPCHARELIKFKTFHLFEEVFGQTLEGVEHILLLHKRHLAVDLRELGLTVGAEVLIAEATHDLEVAVHASHHQQLLVLLRALRQSVELARVHTAWHHEVAGAFGRALDEHRGLDFEEVKVA